MLDNAHGGSNDITEKACFLEPRYSCGDFELLNTGCDAVMVGDQVEKTGIVCEKLQQSGRVLCVA